ncbi:MAG: ABC transporter permease, partial [Angelakisella sp.]
MSDNTQEMNAPKRRTKTGETWKRLKKNKLAVLGLITLLLIIFLAIFAEQIAPYSYSEQDYSNTFQGPSKEHWMGTDNYGRDILSRVIFGTRVSLQIGFISLLGGAFIGCVLGAIAGYFGGIVDTLIMRVSDILMSIPRTVLAIAIATTLGAGITNAMIAVAISS